MNRLEPGSRIGRYRIVRRLGAGAMGEVYLAEDPQIGRQLAIKTVLVEQGRPQEIEDRKKRLLREARAAGKLLHPSIVTLFDAGEDGDVLYLAFEFIDGSDLDRRLAEGAPLTLGETLAIVRQAAEGLDYAHRQGVVHRDIKPSNLMLTADGRVKVADFGIAKVLDQTSDLTTTGSVVGSPHYLSPEQIRGDALDGRTDIFSLGILLYEILGRQRPFDADTLTTLVYQILHKEPAPLAERRPDLSPRLVALVHRMMHKDRDQRFATAAELVAEIAARERELSPEALAGRARPESEPTGATTLLPKETATAIGAPPPSPPRSPTAPTVVPPPPPPVAPAAPPAAPPAPAVAAAASPAPKGRLAIVLLVVGALVVALVAVGLGARRFVAQRLGASPAPAPAASVAAPASSEPRAAPVAATPPSSPAPAPAVESAASKPESSPYQPGDRPVVARVAAEPAKSAPEPPPAAVRDSSPRPAPVEERRAPVPAPAAPAPVAPAPAPVATVAEASPEPPDGSAARELRDELVRRVPVAREMTTGMSLSLELTPKKVAERVVVRFDRIVIGRAADWNAKVRGGRAYAVAEEGLHIVTFLLDGADVYRIRIDARPGGGTTPIVLDLGAGRPRR